MAEAITALEWLGLPLDADTRAVKRAYAQRLKQVRPDVDPAGFQTLHTVYQMALQQCLMRETLAAVPVEGGDGSASASARLPGDEGFEADASPQVEYDAHVPEAVSSTDEIPGEFLRGSATQPAAASFDFASFYAELLRVATSGEAGAVSAWLLQQPALWSLRTKPEVGARLVAMLHNELPPLHDNAFNELLEFFDLDHLRSGLDALTILDLRRRLQVRWDFAPEDVAERARRLRERHRHLYLSQDNIADLLRRLARPLPPWRLLAMTIWPETLRDRARFLRGVLGNTPREVPVSMDRAQVQFWLAASDTSRLSLVRIEVTLLRCVAVILASTLIGFLLGQTVERTTHIAEGALLLGMAVGGIYLGMMLWLEIARWQSAPETNAPLMAWRRWLFVPLLAAVGAAFAAISTPVALTILGLATSFAYARLSGRAGGPLLGNVLGRFGAVGLLYLSIGLLVVAINFPLVAAGVACLLWTMDAWRHRFLLRRR